MNRIYNEVLQKFDPSLCGLFQNHKPSCVVIDLAISSLEHIQSQVLLLTSNISWQISPSVMVMRSPALSDPAESAIHTLTWCDKGLDKNFWLTEESSPCCALELSDPPYNYIIMPQRTLVIILCIFKKVFMEEGEDKHKDLQPSTYLNPPTHFFFNYPSFLHVSGK